jgi:hypothetical protein
MPDATSTTLRREESGRRREEGSEAGAEAEEGGKVKAPPMRIWTFVWRRLLGVGWER